MFLKQDNRTVKEYELEFTRLSRFAPDLISTKEARAKRLLNGLHPVIQHDLATWDLVTYGEVLEKAL